MQGFILRFLLSNIFITIIIGFLLGIKYLLKNHLTNRMQYHLWFVMLAFLFIPFLPIRPIILTAFLSWFQNENHSAIQDVSVINPLSSNLNTDSTMDWMNNFSISVLHDTPSIIETGLFIIWIVGILIMIICVGNSAMKLNSLKCSALPLQNPTVHTLYNKCLHEMGLKKPIPIYSTAFLKSPALIGLLRPSIYLPIHLISDYNATEMRYMLLHELQHYVHKDVFPNYLMNLAGIFYWFNPLVWLALREMRNDREIACDTSVLQMLNKREYECYGTALINFTEKVSRTPFPFATGIGGSITQIKKRILNIASYHTFSFSKRITSVILFITILLPLFCLAPTLFTYALQEESYHWKPEENIVSYVDYSTYFGDYNGSFVLYSMNQHSFSIYNKGNAMRRISPNSTYKIYDALWGLETSTITLMDSTMRWDGSMYPFDSWNKDQNLDSAIKNSVNWYFQSIDARIGTKTIQNYIKKTQYGNQDISGGLSSYWMESSLKISPIEQVELLSNMYNNSFNFAPKHISEVKDALFLSSTEDASLYGKTGTGSIHNQSINGWFVGFVEYAGDTCFFATNIQGDTAADGTNASEITLSILSDLGVWNH